MKNDNNKTILKKGFKETDRIIKDTVKIAGDVIDDAIGGAKKLIPEIKISGSVKFPSDGFESFDIKEFEPAPRKSPLTYPGKRPKFSYFLHKAKIFKIKLTETLSDSKIRFDRGIYNLEELLKKLELSPLRERIPVLAYGSNAAPSQLKLKGFSDAIVIYGKVSGIDACYAGFISEFGYVPATLADNKKSTINSYIILLDREGLERMDKTEGRDKGIYNLVNLKKEFVAENIGFKPIYAYLTSNLDKNKKIRGILIKDGKPLKLSHFSQKELLETFDRCVVDETTRWITNYEIIQNPLFPE